MTKTKYKKKIQNYVIYKFVFAYNLIKVNKKVNRDGDSVRYPKIT